MITGSDTVLEVGAVVDLSNFMPEMDKMASTSAETAESVSASFKSMQAPSELTMGQLSESINMLIASNERLMASVTEMSTAVVAGMERMSAGVTAAATESEFKLAQLSSSFAGVAESAGLASTGTMAALAPLGAMLGAGVLVGFTEKIKNAQLELKRLSDMTGVSVTQLKEFQLAMEELGVPTENISRIMVHVAYAMAEAAEGSKLQMISFQQMGINTDNWSKKLPPVLDVLLQMSDHLHKFKGNSDDAAAASQILGMRMGVQLAGGLAVGSKAIREHMEANKSLGEATEKSVSSAAQLQQTEAVIGSRIEEALLPVMSFFADFLDTITILWDALKANWTELVAVIVMGAMDIIGALMTFGSIAKDVLTFNWGHIKDDWNNYMVLVKNNLNALKKMVKEDNDQIRKDMGLFNPPETAKSRRDLLGGEGSKAGSFVDNRVTQWAQALERMKLASDNFHAVTLQDEVNYWEQILKTQHLISRERQQVEEQLLRARHALAVDNYRRLISLDEAYVNATREGSNARMAAIIKERDHVVNAYGKGSEQEIAANKKVLDEQMRTDQLLAESVEQSVSKQASAYESGSAQRIALFQKSIDRLKEMQANLAEGKTAAGKAEFAGQIGPTAEDNSKLRILARQNESDQIQKIVDNLNARVNAEQKTQSSHEIQLALQTERQRIASIERTGRAFEDNTRMAEKSANEIVSIAQREAAQTDVLSATSASSQLRSLVMIENQGLMSFDKRIELSRKIIARQELEAASAIATRIEMIKAEERSTNVVIEEEAIKRAMVVGTIEAEKEANEATAKSKEEADARIQALEKQLVDFYRAMGVQKKHLDEEVNNDRIAQAQKVSDGIVSAFQKAFAQMQSGARYHVSLMSEIFRSFEQSFGQMVNNMLAHWAKMLAQKMMLSLTHQAAINAIETAGTAKHMAQEQAKVGATAVAQGEETAVTAAGSQTRSGVGLGEAIKHIMSDAAEAAAHAFKWVMKEVPFPLNAALAPMAAAAAFTGTMAFATFASAAGGMEVDRDQMVQVHKDEKILPANISKGFTDIIKAGTFASPTNAARALASPIMAGSTGSSSSTHYHQNEFNLYHTGNDARRILEDELVPRIKQAMRNGELESL